MELYLKSDACLNEWAIARRNHCPASLMKSQGENACVPTEVRLHVVISGCTLLNPVPKLGSWSRQGKDRLDGYRKKIFFEIEISLPSMLACVGAPPINFDRTIIGKS